MSGLRRRGALHRQARRPDIVPMQCVPQTNIGQGRNDLRVQQIASAPLVQGHVSGDSIQEGGFSIELGRRLGVTQTTAWTLKQKLAQVMIERNAAKRLQGEVQLDNTYIGGHHPGKCGRGAGGKTPFVAAVSMTGDGKPDQIVLRRVAGFSKSGDRQICCRGAYARRSRRVRCTALFSRRDCGGLHPHPG